MLISLSDLESILGITRLLLSNPRKLYSLMPTVGGYRDPLLFVVVMAVVSSVLFFIGELLLADEITKGAPSMWSLLLLPLFMIGVVVVMSGLMHIIWILLGADNEYEVSFRCVAYSAIVLPALSVLRLVPFVGDALVLAGWVYLMAYATEIVITVSKIKIVVILAVLGAGILFLGIQEDQEERKNSDRTEEFNSEMRRLEGMSTDLK